MEKKRLYIFDTTLRDGAQTQGVDFSAAEKRRIAQELDQLGVDYIEGGYPAANPTDAEFFADPPKLETARLTAFSMTARADRGPGNDPDFATLLDANAQDACLVAKSWDFHVHTALEISLEENLNMIGRSVEAARPRFEQVMLDAEHFFDGFKANPDYAIKCLAAAREAGARWIVLCDTNGGTLPHEISEITAQTLKAVPGGQLGIHAHNDTGNAVANTLAAIRAGARQVQGTLNGLGERCGNANLVSLLPTLLLKPDFAGQFTLGVSLEALKGLSALSHRFDDEILNRRPVPYAPYVGRSAFAHKGGIHVSAVRKDPRTYEHIPPEAVGNARQIVVSRQAGRANLLAQLERAGIRPNRADPGLARLLTEVKQRENAGWSYDGAEASLELLARRFLGEVPHFFDVLSYRVLVERRNGGKARTRSQAQVELAVEGEKITSAGEGNGPVNALDQALRSDLGKYSRYLGNVRLVDYKVRILDASGTGATTRVLVESADDRGQRWRTVGVSPNIVEASFQALTDGIIFRLLREGAPGAAQAKNLNFHPKKRANP